MKLGKYNFKLTSPTVMGICNVTPDSFSDGGKSFKSSDALKNIKEMVKNGASIIDIGAESTRPGSDPLSQKEEILFYFNNQILEGSTTNLIFVNDNKLFIPKNYYYYGITLEYLIKNLPYKIYRTDINISSLHQFSEILLVGSGKGVVSISFIKQFNWYRSSMKIYNFLSKKYLKILLK